MAAALKQRIVRLLVLVVVVVVVVQLATTSATESNTCLQDVVSEISEIRKNLNSRLKTIEIQATQCSTSSDSPTPASGWQFSPTTQKSYRVIFELVDRATAVSRCMELGSNARLVVVNDNVENEAIKNILRSYNRNVTRICDGPNILYPGYGGFWTSGQRVDPSTCASTQWVWRPRAGVTLPVTYTDWYYGEPNCGYGSEQCIQFGSATFEYFRWNDINCGWPLCPLCEMQN